MAERQFVIPVRRRWTLFILPVLALLYFLGVVALAVLNLRTVVPTEILVLVGVALFLLVALVEIPFLFRRRARKEEPEEVQEEAATWGELPPRPPAAPVAPVAPLPPPAAADDEYVATGETQQGLRVLEYSAPAKSRHRGAVYAKSYVPVTKEHVLRVETLAAEGADL